MGVVYKAVDLQLERIVALKFLPADAAFAPTDKEQLLREARSASQLDHPNIGVIYGLEEAEGQLFIVMGYYDGETLTQRIARDRLGLPEAIRLGTQIAAGLAHAHAKNLVHRDIKPSNIILTKNGTAKIVDFGLARVVASASATQTLTTSGTPKCPARTSGFGAKRNRNRKYSRGKEGLMGFVIVIAVVAYLTSGAHTIQIGSG